MIKRTVPDAKSRCTRSAFSTHLMMARVDGHIERKEHKMKGLQKEGLKT